MRLLLVEDEPLLTDVFRSHLRAEGFQVDACPAGQQASQLAQEVRYDLALLSLLLPGDQALALLRAWHHAGRDFPILALGGTGAVAEQVQALALGADDYLARPLRLEELTARVRALVRQVNRLADPILRVHDLEIDTGTRTVRRAGRVIRLSRREY